MIGSSAVATTTGQIARPHADSKNAPILYVAIRRAREPEVKKPLWNAYQRKPDSTLS